MKLLPSIVRTRFRQAVLVFYALASLLPMLILIHILLENIFPLLDEAEMFSVRNKLTFMLSAMLFMPILGLALIHWWIRSLEKLTRDVTTYSSRLTSVGAKEEGGEGNEMLALRHHFEGLYAELQEKINQISQYSNMLIEDNIKLSAQAATDELTTLYNRRHFDERLDEEVARAERHSYSLSLIMIDMDRFKEFNDKYGHQVGDRILRSLGLLIRTSIRKSDIPFRYGGDEFSVILPDCELRDAAQIAGKMISAVASHDFGIENQSSRDRISISCGVAEYTGEAKRLVSDADKSLYQAKHQGKGRVVFGHRRKAVVVASKPEE